MLALYVIGFVAGIIAGISPCILPVLPVVLVAGATLPPGGDPAAGPPSDETAVAGGDGAAGKSATARSHRALAVVAGLVVSFSVFILVGSSLLSALGLPQDFLRNAGLVVLGLVAVGLIVPPLGHLLERPFVRFGRHQPTGTAGAFVLGLGLGVLFVPCAGPVLTTISVISAHHRVGLATVVLTVDFAAGAAVPLLLVALAGQHMAQRVTLLRSYAPRVRQIGGVVLLVMTVVLALNLTDGLQRVVPGYTSALQQHIENSSFASKQLAALEHSAEAPSAGAPSCTADVDVLQDCGRAPAFVGISRWLNTPGDRPLTLTDLRGKVVLVDFWTYSCINCQRTLPHLESWYRTYRRDGFVVVGVHTPEFDFEHVVSNVQQAARQLGVHYPIAIDNDYKTWDAYNNNAWPAEYLIDATGEVRHIGIGEGYYGTTESLIRQLLTNARTGVRLPGFTDVPDRTPMEPTTPESYLGYNRLDNFAGNTIEANRPARYQFPASLPANTLALAGTWTVGPEKIASGTSARLELSFQARDVYLVLGGNGSIQIDVNGHPERSVVVSGFPRLYTMVSGSQFRTATLTLTMTPGIGAYDFTFG